MNRGAVPTPAINSQPTSRAKLQGSQGQREQLGDTGERQSCQPGTVCTSLPHGPGLEGAGVTHPACKRLRSLFRRPRAVQPLAPASPGLPRPAALHTHHHPLLLRSKHHNRHGTGHPPLRTLLGKLGHYDQRPKQWSAVTPQLGTPVVRKSRGRLGGLVKIQTHSEDQTSPQELASIQPLAPGAPGHKSRERPWGHGATRRDSLSAPGWEQGEAGALCSKLQGLSVGGTAGLSAPRTARALSDETPGSTAPHMGGAWLGGARAGVSARAGGAGGRPPLFPPLSTAGSLLTVPMEIPRNSPPPSPSRSPPEPREFPLHVPELRRAPRATRRSGGAIAADWPGARVKEEDGRAREQHSDEPKGRHASSHPHPAGSVAKAPGCARVPRWSWAILTQEQP